MLANRKANDMKTKEEIKIEIKKLEAKKESIWNDNEMMKLDRMELNEQRIKALKWVLRK